MKHHIIQLLMALSLLASCRTKQSVMEEHTDSLSLRSFSKRDSMHTDMHFSFEQLDIFMFDTLECDSPYRSHPHLAKHISIRGGRMEQVVQQTHQEELSDSTSLITQRQSTTTSTPTCLPSVTSPPLLPTLLVLLLILLIIHIRKSRTR